MLNVGPNADGELPEPALERMKEIGQWMRVNGDAIYGTRPVPPYKVGQVCLTKKGSRLYALYLAQDGQTTLPERIDIGSVREVKSIHLLGSDIKLEWTIAPAGLSISVPESVRQSPPCKDAWAFEIEGARLEQN